MLSLATARLGSQSERCPSGGLLFSSHALCHGPGRNAAVLRDQGREVDLLLGNVMVTLDDNVRDATKTSLSRCQSTNPSDRQTHLTQLTIMKIPKTKNKRHTLIVTLILLRGQLTKTSWSKRNSANGTCSFRIAAVRADVSVMEKCNVDCVGWRQGTVTPRPFCFWIRPGYLSFFHHCCS